jgi:hypothetical protein
MTRCYCRAIMAALVIVFAWLSFSWAKIAITVLGVILIGSALSGTCCCAVRREAKEQEQANPQS